MVSLAVVGAKNSGKTTVIEGLIGYLTGQGYRVATIKHTSHRHRFDTAGKDSYRHRQAGAALTVAMSREEIAVFSQPDSIDVNQFQEMSAENFDIWIIEGDHRTDQSKVIVTRHLKDFIGDPLHNMIASIGPEKIEPSLPHFEEADVKGLSDFVINTLLSRKSEIS
jgi:molybdopterin-guanine dinucleotide biosynthesis protein B